MHAENRQAGLPRDWVNTIEQLADLVQRLLSESAIREQQAIFPEGDDGPRLDRTTWQRSLDRMRESLLARQHAVEQLSRKIDRLSANLTDEQNLLSERLRLLEKLIVQLANCPTEIV
jgi:small-conductance mechanosensitive channel